MWLLRRFLSSIPTYQYANMDAAKQKALDAIRNNPVMIFSKNGCPYCKETKDLIKSLGVQTNKVKHLELDVDDDGSNIQAALAKGFDDKTNKTLEYVAQKTVPNIFIGGKHIPNGNDGLKKKLRDEPEVLQQKLRDAGAL